MPKPARVFFRTAYLAAIGLGGGAIALGLEHDRARALGLMAAGLCLCLAVGNVIVAYNTDDEQES